MNLDRSFLVQWSLLDVTKALGTVISAAMVLVGAEYLVVRNSLLPISQVELIAILASASLELVMIAAAWYFGLRKHGLDWGAFGLFSPLGCGGFVASVGVLIIGFTSNALYVTLLKGMGWDSLLPPPLKPLYGEGVAGFCVAAVLASFVAPVAEELFFRAFVFPGIGRKYGAVVGACASSVLFALGHLQIGVLVPIFVLGLLLAWLYASTKSIWPCILTHSLYNTTALVVVYFGMIGES